MYKTPLVGLSALGLVLALAGCSISYVAPGAEPDASVPSKAEDADPSQDTGDDRPLPEPSASTDSIRSQYESDALRTTCASGELVIVQAGAVVAIDDECTLVRVEASGVVVLAAHIDTLEIIGAANQVQASSIDTVELGGSGNDVRWESGTPAVNDTGAANTARPTAEG